jgi:hypothetical protein
MVPHYKGIVNTSRIIPSSTVPFSRDSKFVERDAIINEIDSILKTQKRHNRAALYGLGGIGYVFPPTD